MAKQNETPLYSSRITNTYLEYLNKYYPDVDVNDILLYAGMTRYEVEDPGHWFTQKQVDRFHDRAVAKTGNPNIAREAGRYTTSAQRLGAIKQYGLGFMNPLSVYLMVETFYRLMMRGAKANAKKLGPSKVEINVIPSSTIAEKPYQCQNRKGTFESLAKAFTGHYAKIIETHCYHKGDAYCRYVVEWKKTPSLILKELRNYILLGMIVLVPFLFFLLSFTTSMILVLALISSALFLSNYSEWSEKKELYKTIEAQGNAAKELVNEINVRHSNALLVQEIGQATSSVVNTDRLIKNVMNIIMMYLEYDRGMILLADTDQEKLKFHTGIGYSNQAMKSIENMNFAFHAKENNNIISKAFRSQTPYLINRINKLENDTTINIDLFRDIQTHSLICIPIVYEKKSVGVLVAENIEYKKNLTQSDMSLLIGIASQIAVGINNAKSFQLLSASEKKLQQSHNDLELRVEERTAELEQLNKELNLEIAERLKSEQRLKRSIKEKDMLIKEVHHRVKNNLQIISSLLDMSKRRAKHPETVDFLSEAHAKIFTMSLIHSQLYQSDRFDEINMGKNIRELANQLAQFYRGEKNITLTINAPDIHLSVMQAIPCALIVNELISNAYKHAFTNNSTGRIDVTLEKNHQEKIFLKIADNGLGIPDSVDIQNTETLGIKLVRNLVSKQLKGEFKIDATNGTKIDIKFQAAGE